MNNWLDKKTPPPLKKKKTTLKRLVSCLAGDQNDVHLGGFLFFV